MKKLAWNSTLKNEDHGIWSHHFMANRWGNNGNVDRVSFRGLQNQCNGEGCHEIKRCLLLGRKAMTNLDSILKIRHITLPTKVCLVKVMAFPVVMSGCESWTIKKAEHGGIDAFELWYWRRHLWTFWNCKEIQPVHPKGNSVLTIHWKDWSQAEAPVLWPPDVKNWLIRKDPDAGKDWGQEEKGTTEDEMVGWHHQLDEHEFE